MCTDEVKAARGGFKECADLPSDAYNCGIGRSNLTLLLRVQSFLKQMGRTLLRKALSGKEGTLFRTFVQSALCHP